ncbi:MAG: arylsulfatase A-like enzyme [Pirellulaceae bacterium]
MTTTAGLAMDKNKLRFALFVAAIGIFAAVTVGPAAADEVPLTRPNILVIVADDMGWADVGYHNSAIKTPNIDRLCGSGVELDQHYVAPMCTPTRAALLTGRYWSRFGNTTPDNERVLPWGTVTLASLLRDVGYDTGMSGKWHLGSKPEWGPRKFGFNSSHGSLAGGVNPVNHLYKHGPYSRTWHRNDELQDEAGHVTDLIAKEAVRFINVKRETPFFLYVPFTAVHTPFDESKEWLDSAKHVASDRQQYVACAQHMDNAIGQFLTALRNTKQLEKTLIVFFSDNGGTNGDDSNRYPDTAVKGKIRGLNTPLRGWKTQVYEGGIRTPAFAYWKDTLTPKKVTTPLHVIDWLPTISRLVKCPEEPSLKWDGQDIWPSLAQAAAKPDPRVLYWQGVLKKSAALRMGDWKLIVHRTGKQPKIELFDLASDPNETSDLASSKPDLVKQLQQLMVEEQALDDDALPNRAITELPE